MTQATQARPSLAERQAFLDKDNSHQDARVSKPEATHRKTNAQTQTALVRTSEEAMGMVATHRYTTILVCTRLIQPFPPFNSSMTRMTTVQGGLFHRQTPDSMAKHAFRLLPHQLLGEDGLQRPVFITQVEHALLQRLIDGHREQEQRRVQYSSVP